jgi:hypothetical protein
MPDYSRKMINFASKVQCARQKDLKYKYRQYGVTADIHTRKLTCSHKRFWSTCRADEWFPFFI